MSKRFQTIYLLLFLFITWTFQIFLLSPAGATPPGEIITAAKEGLQRFLGEIPLSNLQHMGIQTQGEIGSTELGEGFQIYTISPDKILNFEKGAWVLKDLLTPTYLWRFLVLEKVQPKAVLTVDLISNKWEAVDIGASGLAIQLSKIIEVWPHLAGFQYKFIRIYQATADFIEVSQAETVLGIIPLTSGRIALGLDPIDFNPSDLINFEDVLMGIKTIVKDNLKK